MLTSSQHRSRRRAGWCLPRGRGFLRLSAAEAHRTLPLLLNCALATAGEFYARTWHWLGVRNVPQLRWCQCNRLFLFFSSNFFEENLSSFFYLPLTHKWSARPHFLFLFILLLLLVFVLIYFMMRWMIYLIFFFLFVIVWFNRSSSFG